MSEQLNTTQPVEGNATETAPQGSGSSGQPDVQNKETGVPAVERNGQDNSSFRKGGDASTHFYTRKLERELKEVKSMLSKLTSPAPANISPKPFMEDPDNSLDSRFSRFREELMSSFVQTLDEREKRQEILKQLNPNGELAQKDPDLYRRFNEIIRDEHPEIQQLPAEEAISLAMKLATLESKSSGASRPGIPLTPSKVSAGIAGTGGTVNAGGSKKYSMQELSQKLNNWKIRLAENPDLLKDPKFMEESRVYNNQFRELMKQG